MGRRQVGCVTGLGAAEDIGHIEKNLSGFLKSKTSFKTLMSEELA